MLGFVRTRLETRRQRMRSDIKFSESLVRQETLGIASPLIGAFRFFQCLEELFLAEFDVVGGNISLGAVSLGLPPVSLVLMDDSILAYLKFQISGLSCIEWEVGLRNFRS